MCSVQFCYFWQFTILKNVWTYEMKSTFTFSSAADSEHSAKEESTQLQSRFTGSQEPWNISSSFLPDVSRFISFIIVTCLEIKLAWKHTWIWVTPCKKSSNSIIIEVMLPIWDLFYMLGIQVSLCLQNRLCPIQIGQNCAYLILWHYLMCTMYTHSSKYLVHCTIQKVPINIV